MHGTVIKIKTKSSLKSLCTLLDVIWNECNRQEMAFAAIRCLSLSLQVTPKLLFVFTIE